MQFKRNVKNTSKMQCRVVYIGASNIYFFTSKNFYAQAYLGEAKKEKQEVILR